jgi:heme-degrading monooxygenase HmoA
MTTAMIGYVSIWAFRVKPGSEWEFERIYGPDGDWARLMGQAEGYMNTQLLRDIVDLGRYVTIDSWSTIAAYEKFKSDFAADYEALDEKCKSLTEEEKSLGTFLPVARASRP